jgi:hypothetical protein
MRQIEANYDGKVKRSRVLFTSILPRILFDPGMDLVILKQDVRNQQNAFF